MTDPTISIPADDRKIFDGFEHIDANFIYCPNQFFDLCLPNCSRGAIRLVAYLLRQTLGWVDRNGEPIHQEIQLSFAELVEVARISRGSLRKAIDEAIAKRFIVCVAPGRMRTKDDAGRSARFAICWDETETYATAQQSFRGFFAGAGNVTPIPKAFFDDVVPVETAATVKVVGAVLRHTIGFRTRFGQRRKDAPLSHSFLQELTNIRHRPTLNEAIHESIRRNYIVCVEPGVVAAQAEKRRPASYAPKWLAAAEQEGFGSKSEPASSKRSKNRTSIGSETEPAERFKIRTNEKTGKENYKDHDAAEKTIAKLTAFGFDRKTASELAKKRGLGVIEQQIGWLKYRNVRQNPIGMLRKAIDEDWPKPADVERHDRLKKRRRNERAAEAKREAEERLITESRKARRERKRRLIEEWQTDLPPGMDPLFKW